MENSDGKTKPRSSTSKRFFRKFELENLNYLIIFLLGIILVSIWFKKGLLIAYGEYGDVLMRPDRWLQSVRYIWNDTYGTGVPANFVRNSFIMAPFFVIVSILSKVLSMVSIQRGLFGVLLISGGIFTYLMASRLTMKDSQKPLAGLLAALFYMLNPYAMLGVWNRFVYSQMFMYASLPLILFLYIEGLERKRTYYIFFLASASAVFYLAYSHPAYVVTQWFVLLFYFLFFLYVNRGDKSKIFYAIRFSAGYGALWLLFHAWWILPFLRVARSIWSVDTPTENINNLIGVSKYLSLYYVSRLLQSTAQFVAKGWGTIYYSIPFGMISWLIPLIVLVGVILGFRNRFAWYFVGLSMVGLFFAKGVNPPWGNLLLDLFKLFPVLGIFRNPFEKIGIIVPLGYAFLFGTGLTSLIVLLKERSKILGFTVLIFILITVLVIYPWPMWTGKVFGGAAASVFGKVPGYYASADKWISRDKEDFRILHLPLVHIDWIVYNWSNGYHGFVPDHVLFGKPAITGYQWAPFVDELYRLISKVLYTNQLWKIMAIFNAKYVVLHNDINFKASVTDSPLKVRKALLQTERPDLSKGLSFLEGDRLGWVQDPKDFSLTWDANDTVLGNASLRLKGYPKGKQFGLAYDVPADKQDWSDKAFLVIWIKSNVPLQLFLAIVNGAKDDYIAWNGKEEPEYSIKAYEAGDWKQFILPLDRPNPRQRIPFDFRKVTRIFIASDHLDPGKEVVLEVGGVSAAPKELSPIKGIKYIENFGKLNVFKIEEKYFLKHIYATNQFEFSQSPLTLLQDVEENSFIPGEKIVFVKSQLKAKDILALSKLKAHRLYRPKIVFRKINAAKYIIKVENASRPFFLIFSETYNPEWKAYVNGRLIDSHYIVNGYANAYYVAKKGTYDITLEYMPNRLLSLAGKISVAAMGLSILVLLPIAIYKEKRTGVVR